MTTRYVHFSLQLKGALLGAAIITAGGVAMVCKNALPTKHTIYSDQFATAASNPKALTRGNIDFWVAESALVNGMVDLYIQCPGDQFVVAKNLTPSGPNELVVPDNRPDQTMVIPWDQADFTATTETATGFTEPAANTAVFTADSTGAWVRVTAIDSTETLDVGTLSTDSGDADGFMSAVSIGTLGLVQDEGALLGTLAGHISGGKSITITTSAGADTGKGFIYLPYQLKN